MPVLSPHRSNSSALGTNFRTSFSTLDRQPYYSSSYGPRLSSYSERFSSRTYTDSDGRRITSRSASITEDGVTRRYREDSRDSNSASRDLGLNNQRDGSIFRERESSLTRDSSRCSSSTVDVVDSIADLHSKYSPSNYVPAIHRKNDNISRSKSINDIGLPPISSEKFRKKVNDVGVITTNSSVSSNNTTNDNYSMASDLSMVSDSNGNRASVADLRKRFDTFSTKIKILATTGDDNKFRVAEKKVESGVKNAKKLKIVIRNSRGGADVKLQNRTKNSDGDIDVTSFKITSNHQKSNELGGLKEKSDINIKNADLRSADEDVVTYGAGSINIATASSEISCNGTRTDFEKGDDDNNVSDEFRNSGENGSRESIEGDDFCNKPSYLNDLNTSPKLPRSTVSPSSSAVVNNITPIANNLNSVGNSTLARRSIDRERRSATFDEDLYAPLTGGSYRAAGGIPQGVTTVATAGIVGKTFGLNGLKNIGNTCFMNSVIQCLSNTKQLLEYLRKDLHLKDINKTNSSMKGALIGAFAEVIKELWSDESYDRVVNTVSLKSQIQRFAPRFIGYAQQDAQEFLRYLLEGLHEDVNRVTERPKAILTEIDEKLSDVEKSSEAWNRYLRMDNSRIVDIFVGQLKSTLKCTFCGHCSVTFDPFWDLSLPIPQRTGQLRLSQCLESFTREETMDGDEKPTCSKCRERRKCTKSFSIQKFPKILVIHLKRFSPTERFRGKLSVTVDFPLEGLDMSKYAASEGVSPCSRYNLYAVSNHSGTTYSGHYTAYCRHPYNQTWHEYNDSRVSSVSPRSVVSSEAYVLFYEQEGQRSHL